MKHARTRIGNKSLPRSEEWGSSERDLARCLLSSNRLLMKGERPDAIELLYYSYHMMVGLGTFFIAIMGLAFLFTYRLFWGKVRPAEVEHY